MPETGLEPVQDKSYQILSLGRLPFRHSGIYTPQNQPYLSGEMLGEMLLKITQNLIKKMA